MDLHRKLDIMEHDAQDIKTNRDVELLVLVSL